MKNRYHAVERARQRSDRVVQLPDTIPTFFVKKPKYYHYHEDMEAYKSLQALSNDRSYLLDEDFAAVSAGSHSSST